MNTFDFGQFVHFEHGQQIGIEYCRISAVLMVVRFERLKIGLFQVVLFGGKEQSVLTAPILVRVNSERIARVVRKVVELAQIAQPFDRFVQR